MWAYVRISTIRYRHPRECRQVHIDIGCYVYGLLMSICGYVDMYLGGYVDMFTQESAYIHIGWCNTCLHTRECLYLHRLAYTLVRTYNAVYIGSRRYIGMCVCVYVCMCNRLTYAHTLVHIRIQICSRVTCADGLARTYAVMHMRHELTYMGPNISTYVYATRINLSTYVRALLPIGVCTQVGS